MAEELSETAAHIRVEGWISPVEAKSNVMKRADSAQACRGVEFRHQHLLRGLRTLPGPHHCARANVAYFQSHLLGELHLPLFCS